jgi:flavodoxin
MSIKKIQIFIFSSIIVLITAVAVGAQSNNLGKVLILYYSWSENASTEKVAKIIQGLTNADIIKVEPVTPFPRLTYQPMTQWVKGQQEQGIYPTIKDIGVDLASYDFIFVGTPVWYQTLALPIVTLLRQTDFRGKPAAAFATAQGGPGAVISDFEEQVKSARVRQGMYFNNVASDRQIADKVTTWVRGLRR